VLVVSGEDVPNAMDVAIRNNQSSFNLIY